ncbi:hypothetical protein ACS8FB_05600 [Psychrobacter sp. 1U1]|uniref:hypothetical protein n=1 Tax=Psychrobacter sp. 1U1 TaxID=3453576 RepID=UPI003F48CD72
MANSQPHIGSIILDDNIKKAVNLPNTIDLSVDEKTIVIKAFNANEANQNLNKQMVNIFASGPSIADLVFHESLISEPSIFVNGSLSLTREHSFSNIVGYVISDARFIKNNPEVLSQYYKGQPLYATVAVYEAIRADLPNLISQYHENMRVIFPADRPLSDKTNTRWLTSLPIIKKIVSKKIELSKFANHSSFVINSSHEPETIGVSLDITDGFIEAGTVAYIAAQLAFSRQAGAIHLYGIDLLNSSKPRFYEDNSNNAPSKLDKAVADRIVPSFNLMGRVYSKLGVPLINHSSVSKKLFDFD